MAIDKKTFTNTDLNGSHQLVYTHNLNTMEIVPVLYDNDNIMYPLQDIFAFGDAGGSNLNNVVTVSFSDAITGTWNLLLQYTEAGASTTGRRAFELTTTSDPTEDYRLIIGKELTQSVNFELSSFIAWLLTKLDFLQISNNLSDLENDSTSRDNLGVYSKSAVDAFIALKADLFKAGTGAVLGVNNDQSYNPSSNYNPATKLYADTAASDALASAQTYTDNNAPVLLAEGSHYVGDPGSGFYDGNVSLGTTLANNNYMVIGEIEDSLGSTSYWVIRTKTTTYFRLVMGMRDNSDTQDITFNWKVISL